MEFQKLALEHIGTLKPYFEKNQCRINDCTVGGTFIWRDYHETGFAIEDETLYLKVTYPVTGFAPPRGDVCDMKAFKRIAEYCSENGLTARLFFVSEPVLGKVLGLFPGSKVKTDRAWSDYLYLSEDIVNLSGRKFAGQRNHINHFTREYHEWSFERITESNVSDVKEYIKQFTDESVNDSPVDLEGSRKALEVLDNLTLYGQFGGALLVGDRIVGVSLAEIKDDTMYIHVEKAETGYYGAYPMLMNRFARTFVTEGVKYINREEDDGIEGLRKSKLSWHPVQLLDKYTVELNLN